MSTTDTRAEPFNEAERQEILRFAEERLAAKDAEHDAAKGTVNPDTHFVQPKVSGYRQLTPADTVLMNEAKALGNQLMDLVERIQLRNAEQHRQAPDLEELSRLQEAEPGRWAALGKTHIQQGVMFLVRAVAQPSGV